MIDINAAKWSSDLLNRIIDHAHLTGQDYLMALEATQERGRGYETVRFRCGY